MDPNLTASAYLITKSCQLFVKISEEIFVLKKGAAGLMGEREPVFLHVPRGVLTHLIEGKFSLMKLKLSGWKYNKPSL